MIRFVPWSEVGTISVSPGDNVVEVGAFELAEGADTLWVRMTNTGTPGPWPWSYGILSFKTDEGQPLGSIKAYNSFDGEVFKLGVGLPPSVRAGVLTFEPRGFNMAWIKQGNPWSLKFEAQSGGGTVSSGYWNRDPDNGVITPKTSGDNLDITPGWIKAKSITLVDGTGAPTSKTVPGFQQGTWSPLLSGGGVISNAVWSRIGQQVFLSALVKDLPDGGSGVLTVADLPYSLAVTGCVGTCMSQYITTPPDTVYGRTSNQNLSFYKSSSGGWTQSDYSKVNNSDANIYFNAAFLTDDTSWEPVNEAVVTPALPLEALNLE